MAKNELLIGLGGTGGCAIAAFRKACILRKKDVDELEGNGYSFEYLYLDSNRDIMENSCALWKVYEEDFSLNETDFVYLKESMGREGALETLSQHDNIKPWLGDFRGEFAKKQGKNADNEAEADGALVGIEGAGQMRRLGRILFALHAHTIQSKIREKFKNLTGKGNGNKINIRIFCTLVGGTGSGSVIDMITLIHALSRKNGVECSIHVYPFIAGVGSGSDFNTGQAFENEYAALRDINALMVDKFHPFVMDGSEERYHSSEYGGLPIHSVVLSSDISNPQRQLDAQIENIANACLDSIIYTAGFGSDGKCLKAFTLEDLDGKMFEPTAADKQRAYRFSSHGTKRWCVPTEQLKKLLRADYEKRLMKSLLEGTELPQHVKRDLSKLRLQSELSETDTVKKMNELSGSILQSLSAKEEAINKYNKRDADLLKSLRKDSDEWVAQAKMLKGRNDVMALMAQKYPNDAERIIRDIAIAADQLLEWSSSTGVEAWGLQNIYDRLGKLISDVENWPKQESYQLIKDEELHTKDEILVKQMMRREEEWEKIGILTKNLTNLDENMIQWQIEDIKSRIKLALRSFENYSISELAKHVVGEIIAYRAKVKLAIDDVTELAARAETTISNIEGSLPKKDGTVSTLNDVYELDSDNLEKVRHRVLEADSCKQRYQRQLAETFCPKWRNEIGSLSKYSTQNMARFVKEIQSDLYKSSNEIQRDACDHDVSLHNVLVSSIMERLDQLTQGRDFKLALGKKVDDLVKDIGTSCTVVKGSGAISIVDGKSSASKALIIGLPKSASKYSELCDWLKKTIKTSVNSDTSSGGVSFYTHNTEGEIRIMYVIYWIPARFATVVPMIHEKYQKATKRSDASEVIYFANIDDNDIGLHSFTRPTLIPEKETDKEKARRAEFAKHLFVRHGEKKIDIISISDGQVYIVDSVSDSGRPRFCDKQYQLSEFESPGSGFTEAVGKAIRLALNSMTSEDKKEVERIKESEYEQLIADGLAETNPKVLKANKESEEYKKWLGLA